MCQVVAYRNSLMLYWCTVATRQGIRRLCSSRNCSRVYSRWCPVVRKNGHYTVSQNKTPTRSFCDNFGKYGPILIIFSPLHSTVNSRRSFYIICHLTSNLLPYYPVKFECATEYYIRYSHSIQNCAKSFIFSKYLQGCHDLDDISMPIHLQCYSMCSKYPPSARRHALSRARNLSMDASMTRCSMLSQAFNRRCRNLLHVR